MKKSSVIPVSGALLGSLLITCSSWAGNSSNFARQYNAAMNSSQSQPQPQLQDDEEDINAPDEVGMQRGIKRGKTPRNKSPRRFIVEGDGCKSEDMSVLENNGVVSILLDQFQMRMDEGKSQDGKKKAMFCKVDLDLTPPEGQKVIGFKQVFSGSVLKSRDSRVLLDVSYKIGKRAVSKLPFIWKEGEVLEVGDSNAEFQVSVKNKMKTKCRPDLPYTVRLDLTAMRSSVDKDFVLAGVDSIESAFAVDVEPVYAPCKAASRHR